MPRRSRVSITRRAGFLGTLAALCGVLVVQACTDRTVVAVEIGSVAVQPPAASIVQGETLQFRAVVEDIGGRPLPRATVTWSTDPTDLLLVDSAGLGRALLAGTVQISAAFRGVTGTADVTVLPAPHIELNQDSVIFYGAAGAQSPAAIVVQVATGSGGPIGDVSTDVRFPTGEPSGWLTPALAATEAPTTLTLTPQTATLPVGSYTATVSVTSPQDDRSPVDLPVRLSLIDVTVTESGGESSVAEDGGTDDFSVVLAAQPDSDVVIDVTSTDTTELVVDPAQLTFTPSDWDQPQTVTVTGRDDVDADGDQPVDVIVAVVDTLSDPAYAPFPDRPVTVTVIDDDVAPGITVQETPPGAGAGTLVNETGATDDFTVVLEAPPLSDVVLAVVSEDTTEVVVGPDTLTFTPADWSIPQTVTVTGVDDILDDGDQFALVTVSVVASLSDDAYDAVPAATVNVTNIDDDSPSGLNLQLIGGTTVNEAGTLTDDFTVALATEPASVVVVSVTSQDTTEIAVDQDTLTFTPFNWSDPQVVSVTGVDDALIDGTTTTNVVVAVVDALSDDNFDGIVQAVSWMTLDDDVAGLDVVELGGGTTVGESGTTDEVTIALTARPTSNVVVAVSSADPGEATAAPGSLTFTPALWNVPQTVTVTGVDDMLDDGDQNTAISFTVVDAQSDTDFAGVSASVVATTTDDDGVGFTINEPGSTIVGEGATQDTFMVLLDAQPTSNVVIDLASTNTAEATVAPASLTFTPANWSTPQNAVVTGVDDDVDDGDQVTVITADVSAGSDPAFIGLSRQVLVTTVDDDTASFLVTESGGSTQVTEAGGTDDFTIVLLTQPVADVVIDVTSTDIIEATVSPGSLTFTPANWDVAQAVTVTGANDLIDDGDQVTQVVVAINAGASDDVFDPVPDQSVSVTTVDDDTAALVLQNTGGITVSESGTTADFTIQLGAQPVLSVLVTISSSDPGESAATPPSVTFTPVNWATPRTVTIVGVDDAVIDGNQGSTITVAVDAGASDPAFGGLAQTFGVTTSDDDAAGFTILEVGGTRVNESGSQDDFRVVLDAQPADSVVFDVVSTDTNEVTVLPARLVFTTANWNVEQVVTVTGVDDSDPNPNPPTTVTVTANAGLTADDAFDGLSGSVIVTNSNDDGVGMTVTEINSTVVPESGLFTDDFTVVLDAQPNSNVVIDVTSRDTGEVDVSPTTVTFTPTDWDVVQTITVTGVDDALIDGNQTTTIDLIVDDDQSDNAFDGLFDFVTATTLDDDVAGFTLADTAGLSVSETGTTDAFTVVLDAEPMGSVQFNITSLNTGEVLAGPTQITFTGANWNVPQDVTLTGQDDVVVDGIQTTTIQVQVDGASDPAFANLPLQTATVETVDDDAAGLVVTETAGATLVAESGSTDMISVSLAARPNLDVIITAASADNTEATITPAAVTITPATWDTPRDFVVTGADDAVDDGDQTTVLTLAVDNMNSDPAFANLSSTVTATTTDDDAAGFALQGTTGLVVSEAGPTSTSFDAVLLARPVTNVVLTVTSGDPSEATVLTPTLVFTDLNWSTPQEITVRGVDDVVVDGSIATAVTVSVAAAQSDNAFDTLASQIATVTTQDDDAPGFILADTASLGVSESGSTDTFSVVLARQPLSDVSFTVASSDPDEVVASPTTITFTPGSWDVPRSVTLTGVNDFIIDGPVTSTITVAVNAGASDPAWGSVAAQQAPVETDDDDVAGLLVVEQGGTRVSETGSTDQFDVSLTAQPATNVVLHVVSTDTEEATVSPGTLTFTNANWSAPQSVTVTGVDDDISDGEVITDVTITVNAALSDDDFDGLADTVRVATTDNDAVGFSLQEFLGTTVTEAPGAPNTDQIGVVLDSQPAGEVVLSVLSRDLGEVTVSTDSLTFTATDWDQFQQITVTGQDDDIVDGDQTTAIVLAVDPARSDVAFQAVPPDSVLATTIDDDPPAFTLTESGGTTVATEGGPTDSVTVVLAREPVGPVRITVASADQSQVTVAPAVLDFNSVNWDTAQVVTVTAANLAFVDGPATSVLTFAVDDAASDDLWDPLPNQTVTATANDNDVAEVLLTHTNGNTTVSEDGATDQVRVVLGAGRPLTDVVIDLSSGNTGEATVTPPSLTFDSTSWASPQFVTVTGVDDGDVVDGAQTTQITASVNDASSDDAWDAVGNETLNAVTNDNDVPGFSIIGANITVDEDLTTDSFRVELTAQPRTTDVVVLDITSDNDAEVEVVNAPATLTFNDENWNQHQWVVVRGVADGLPDGDQVVPVIISINLAGTATLWDGVAPDSILVTNENR